MVQGLVNGWNPWHPALLMVNRKLKKENAVDFCVYCLIPISYVVSLKKKGLCRQNVQISLVARSTVQAEHYALRTSIYLVN